MGLALKRNYGQRKIKKKKDIFFYIYELLN